MKSNLKKKVYLCSFASPDLKLSVNRFNKQSHELKFYEEIKTLIDEEFIRLSDLRKEAA